MKRVLLIFIVTFTANIYAQPSSIHEGSWLIEINTGSRTTGNTAFYYSSIDGNSEWNVGADLGYFIKDNFALKFGFGYGHNDEEDNPFAYKLGMKWYMFGMLPLGLDFTGVSQGDFNANYLGGQLGYAWFVSDRLSLEPTLRYNVSLDKAKAKDEFQFLIGFAFHL